MRANPAQQGIALITAILIVAVVSASAVYLIDSGYTVMRKTAQRVDNEQLLQLARAVEDYGIDLIFRDGVYDILPYGEEQEQEQGFDPPGMFEPEQNPLGYDPINDSRFEFWTRPQTPDFLKADLEDGFARQDVLYITDLNRFLNINNLHFSNSADNLIKAAFNSNAIIFRELIEQLEIKDVDAEKITNNVIDWLDHDDDSRTEILLSETDVYRRAGSNYRPANRPIASIGELQHVLGMTPELMDALSNYLVALPVYIEGSAPYKLAFSPDIEGAQGIGGQNKPVLTRINVNTCAPELLAGLFALYNNQGAMDLAVEKQGYFQNETMPQAVSFSEFYISNLPPDPEIDTEDVAIVIDLVASVYSRFFLIESFFQKPNGVSFTQESLVYKFFSERELPVVIQRQFDWLPAQDLSRSGEKGRS